MTTCKERMTETPAYFLTETPAAEALAAWPWAERLMPVLADAETRMLAGVVTRMRLADAPKDALVGAVMNPSPIVIHGDDDFDAAEMVMRARGLTVVPVVSPEGCLEGMLRTPAVAPAAAAGKWQPVITAGLMGLGVAVGAGVMFLFDPHRGKARRTRVRDQAASWLRREEKSLSKAWANFTNHVTGLETEMKHLFACDEADDQKLTGRVRTKLGRTVTHPRDLQVLASHGHVTLRGKVNARELPELEAAVRGVRGVRSVENQVAVH